MARGVSVVKVHVEKARDSAILAVEIYNKPAIPFRSGGFLVLMSIAWTSLFHAIFFKRKIKPFYRDQQHARRYVKLDGDYKAWELRECLKQYHGPNNPPERLNVEFMIALRNKIEHRSMPSLDPRIFGECQALLFNFEDLLLKEFGEKYTLNESLSLALQFSQLRNGEQSRAVASFRRPLAKDVEAYINTFRSSLSTEVLHDARFSYKVFLIPKLASNPGQADLAVEFVKYDSAKPEEMAKYEKVVAFIKPTVTQVVNPGKLKAGDVCKAVEPLVQQIVGSTKKFNASYHHVRACHFYKIRPKRGEGDVRKTDIQYCQYDDAHRDYVYTEAWKRFLLSELKKPGQYEKVLKGG